MKIVDVCGFYSPHGGGIKTYVRQKLVWASRLGHDITILAPAARDGIEHVSASARIVSVASPPFPLDRKYHGFFQERAVHTALDHIQPDFIEASSPWNSAEFVASYKSPVPRALLVHSDPLSAHFYRWFENVVQPPTVDRMFNWYWERLRRFSRSFETVVSANSSLTERLVGGGIRNAVTIPMGVETGIFSPSFKEETLREELLGLCGLGPEGMLLVCAGRLASEKRVPMLVEAVTSAGRYHPIGLVIFGEGRSRKRILRAIAGNPHVRLLRPVRDRTHFARILASADALVHGCEAETFGMVAAEALASGIPTIAPRMGGACDFVKAQPELGFRPKDTGDVVRAILSLVSAERRPPVSAEVRTMERHLIELFAHYEFLVSNKLVAAG